jgi:xanthine dehydrogenase accessory factor
MKEVREIVGHLVAGGSGAVLATLVAVQGSSYRRPGARMLVTKAGARIGSISGGCLEQDLVERCLRVLASGRAEVVVYDTSAENDLLWGVGQGCHGVIRILMEPIAAPPEWAVAAAGNFREGRPTELEVIWEAPDASLGTKLAASATKQASLRPSGVFSDRILAPPALTIFGAGDDAQPLARIAIELGWNVTVADPRPALPTEARFPGVVARVIAPAEDLVGRSAPAEGSIAVVMTHHFLHDLPLLRDLLPLPLAYLGLLGPKGRADRILADLAADGLTLTAAMRERLHAPVGLDLGADSPQEVALSIVAEIASSLSGRDGSPLRERSLPIHA